MNNQSQENAGCGFPSIIIFSVFVFLVLLDFGPLDIPWWVYLITIIVLFIFLGKDEQMKANAKNIKLAKSGIDASKFFFGGKYLTGHHSINNPTESIQFYIDEEYLKIYNVNKQLIGSINLSKIKNISLEDKTTIQSRVGLKRLLVVGIFAFALKKKEKLDLLYLIIEYDREGFTNEVVFEFEGKSLIKFANEAKNKIQNSIIQSKKSLPKKVNNIADVVQSVKEHKVIENNDYTFDLTGVHINSRKNYIISNCEIGDEVFLYPEPNNEFDHNAIVVRHNNKIIGYVPANETSFIKDYINSEYFAVITFVDNFNDFLDVSITIEKK
ncbi:HIRAN domain-containing protein [Empedobacter sp. ULE_I145]